MVSAIRKERMCDQAANRLFHSSCTYIMFNQYQSIYSFSPMPKGSTAQLHEVDSEAKDSEAKHSEAKDSEAKHSEAKDSEAKQLQSMHTTFGQRVNGR